MFPFKNPGWNRWRIWGTLSVLLLVAGFWGWVPSGKLIGEGPSNVASRKISQAPAELHLKKVSGATDWGPVVRLQADASARDIRGIKELVFGQYNVLNLVQMRGEALRDPVTGGFIRDPQTGEILNKTPPVAKPVEQLKGIADTIQRANPDLMVMEEVDSVGALETLNRNYLGNKYRTVLIEGNDPRGIDIGFLFKRDLPFNIEVRSFRNVSKDNENVRLFSRDLPVAMLRAKGASADSRPLMILIGTHFKSQRGSASDPMGEKHRGEEVLATTEILRYFQQQYGEDVPAFLAGDFNRDIHSGPEFAPLWNKAGLTDAFDLAPAERSLPLKQRVTQTFHPNDGPTQYNQLDSISGSKVVKELGLIKEAQIMPYMDANGRPKPLPSTFQERERNPSDHLMIRVVVDFEKILNRSAAGQPSH